MNETNRLQPKTFRCTRKWPYRAETCPGHTKPSERQGHYIQAWSAEQFVVQCSPTLAIK